MAREGGFKWLLVALSGFGFFSTCLVRMCWNAAISLNTFLFSTFAVALATFNGIIPSIDAFYYMSFVSMQLCEYIAWKDLTDTTFASIFGMALIICQPLFNILTLPPSSLKTRTLLAYIVFAGFVALHVFKHGIELKMTKASNGHLSWNWLKFPGIYILIWVIFVLLPSLFVQNYLRFFINVIVISIIYYTYIQSNTWGSIWCWVANALSIVLFYKVFRKSFGKKGLCNIF